MSTTRPEGPREYRWLDSDDVPALLWQRRYVLLIVAVVGAALAGTIAFVRLPRYQATTTLMPVSSRSGGQMSGLGSLGSQFSGLAALAGVSISGDSRKAESVAVLQSETLTERYIQDNDLLPILFADKWDAARKTWEPMSSARQPTLWKANQVFRRKIRSVTSDTKTGLITFSITWTDPRLAARWANELTSLTNSYLRDKAIAESERNIAFLSQQAAKVDSVGVRQVLYSILESELNTAMLARGSDEYALKVIDPAFVPEKPVSFSAPVWAAIGAVLGGLAGVVGLIAINFRRPVGPAPFNAGA